MITEEEFIEAARQFLRQRLGGRADHVDGDTELVDSGLLDSLMVLEFFFFLEDLRGDAIPPDASSVKAIGTLRTAYQLVALP